MNVTYNMYSISIKLLGFVSIKAKIYHEIIRKAGGGWNLDKKNVAP